jgi:SpoVK/Ycf46/Vps4 family AAA+-type ATPase
MRGESEEKLKEMLEEMPLIVFIDARDSIARNRDKSKQRRGPSHCFAIADFDERNEILLRRMELFWVRQTAQIQSTRKCQGFGSFDWEIDIAVPTETDHLEVLWPATRKKMKLSEDVDLESI